MKCQKIVKNASQFPKLLVLSSPKHNSIQFTVSEEVFLSFFPKTLPQQWIDYQNCFVLFSRTLHYKFVQAPLQQINKRAAKVKLEINIKAGSKTSIAFKHHYCINLLWKQGKMASADLPAVTLLPLSDIWSVSSGASSQDQQWEGSLWMRSLWSWQQKTAQGNSNYTDQSISLQALLLHLPRSS